MNGRGSRLRPIPLLVLIGLLGLVLWRGHTLIELGSQPPEPTPVPTRTVVFLVSIQGLESADLRSLADPLTQRGYRVCTGQIAVGDSLNLFQRAALAADSPPLCLWVKGPAGPREPTKQGELLSHVEAPAVATRVRTLLDQESPARDRIVWLHLRDLGFPPPRPRAARRALHRAGVPLQHWSDAINSTEHRSLESADAKRAIRVLHERGLASVRRALIALSSGGLGWTTRCVLVTGASNPQVGARDLQPLIAATTDPEPDPLRCPTPGELEALLDGSQKTWPMPR